jgi:hypothetical protein
MLVKIIIEWASNLVILIDEYSFIIIVQIVIAAHFILNIFSVILSLLVHLFFINLA